jgi:hypothetical protein
VTGRRAALRFLAGIFALTWLVLPGFGLIDLAVTWSPDWPQVLEAGWGLYFTFLVGAPFVLIAIQPERIAVAVIQLVVAALVLGVTAVVADEPQLWWVPLAIAVETAVLAWLAPMRLPTPDELSPSVPMLAIALVGVVPWSVYALAMYGANREGRADSDITNGIDHYSVQGALGLAIVALGFVAAVWPAGRRFIGTCVGVSAAYLGLVSFGWRGEAGGFAVPWSIASLAWGVAVTVVAWRPATARRPAVA